MDSKNKLIKNKSSSELKMKILSNDTLENVSGGMDRNLAIKNFQKLKNSDVLETRSSPF